MKKKLLLHAGIHRTGTTSIQQTLWSNADQLARNGILYPHYYAAPADAINHQRLAWDIHSGKINLRALRDWAESLAQTDAHTVVLSAEDFCRLKDLSFLECFGDLFEIETAIYLKRQDDWVNSWYNLNIKWPFDGTLSRCTPSEFLDHLNEFHWLRYFDTIERWAKSIGKERIHIRIIEKGQIQDPVADLCDLCGIDFVLNAGLAERVNQSLPADQIEVLRRLGTVQYPAEIRTKINLALSKAPGSSSTNVYPSSVRRLILERYAIGNQRVAERYLGRSDRILFRNQDFPAIPQDKNRIDDTLLISFARNLIDVFCASDAGAQAADTALDEGMLTTDTVTDTGSQAPHTVLDASSRTTDTMTDMGSQAPHTALDASSRTTETVRDIRTVPTESN